MYNEYKYLALGDSITAGVGAPPQRGYVDFLTYYLQQYNPYVESKKIAKKGWKSCELLSTILKNPPLQQYIPTSNLITLLIGGNDLSAAFVKARLAKNPQPLYKAVQQFEIQYNELLKLSRVNSNAVILAANLYNPFPHSPLATQFITLLNQSIQSIANTYGVPIVDLYQAFRGKECELIDGYKDGRLGNFIPFIQKNPIHPNESGHQLIAQCFFNALQMKNSGVPF